jgi:hypothetical protein
MQVYGGVELREACRHLPWLCSSHVVVHSSLDSSLMNTESGLKSTISEFYFGLSSLLTVFKMTIAMTDGDWFFFATFF